MTILDEDTLYNIEDYINDKWVIRYRNWLTLEEAEARYEWLTTSEYWLNRAPDYRIIKLVATIEEIKRYKS